MKRILALYWLTNKYKNDNNNKWMVEDIHDGLSVLRNIFGYIFFFLTLLLWKVKACLAILARNFLNIGLWN